MQKRLHLTKKINNNVALGKDEAGHDVVVFGKGLGFHRMPYDLDDLSGVVRMFKDVGLGQAEMLAGIDDDVLLAASDIADFAHGELDVKLGPNLPLTLADHLQFAIERRKQGAEFANPLANEIASVYPLELSIGRTGVGIFNHRVKYANLPEDEAYNIAMHLVNNEVGGAGDKSSIHLVMESTRLVEGASKIIEATMNVRLSHDSYAYRRFAAHFRYLVARLSDGSPDEKSGNSSLFEEVRKDFPEVYDCVMQIQSYLFKECGWTCSNEELLYLMMHVNRLVASS